MLSQILRILNGLLSTFSVELRRKKNTAQRELPYDFAGLEKEIFRKVEPYTQTSPERVAVLVEAVKHIVAQQIPGDLVECGVWKGGSAMAVTLALSDAKEVNRQVWLYDTYEGMSAPTEVDQKYDGQSASKQLEEQDIQDSRSVWCYAPLDEVKKNLASTQYPSDKVHYVKGRVEDTIPQQTPSSIALLRLDTDWYESTRHELIHLYPKLASGGVLIIDDYGYWKGSKKAVDEYFEQHPPRPLLVRIDSTARIAIKP